MSNVKLTQAENIKTLSLPVFFLSLYIVFTFLPIIYTYMPLFGAIRIVLLSGIALLTTYIITGKTYYNHHIWKNTLFFITILFIIAIFASILVSFDRGKTLIMLEMNMRYFIVTAVMVKIVDNIKRLDYILGLYAFCGIGMAVHTIINYFITGYTYAESVRGAAIESGIFADPNDLALFLNTVLPLLFYFFIKFKKKIILFISIVIVITAIILTYSRGGFLGMIAVFLGLLIFRHQARIKIIILGICCSLLIFSLVPETYIERMSSIQTEAQVDIETGTYQGRLQAWIELTPLVLSISPLLGVGAGCSDYFAGIHYGHWGLMHNSFLQALLELGLIGFALFLALFLLPFKQYARAKKGMKYNENIQKHIDRYQFLLISLIGFAVTAFFLPQAYSPVLFFLIGVLIIQNELTARDLQSNQDQKV
jgi:O-antigen ligase